MATLRLKALQPLPTGGEQMRIIALERKKRGFVSRAELQQKMTMGLSMGRRAVSEADWPESRDRQGLNTPRGKVDSGLDPRIQNPILDSF